MYLIHRINGASAKTKDILKKEGLVTIDWSGPAKKKYGDELMKNAMAMDKSGFANYFVNLGKDVDKKWLTRTRSYYLYNFLNLKKSSIILIPGPGTVTICEVLDKPAIYKPQDGADIGYAVKVKIIVEDISRYNFLPSQLNSKLKYQGANLQLGEADSKAVDVILDNFRNHLEVHNFGETKGRIISQVQAFITEKLNESHFERLIKAYLESIGGDLVEIPSKNNKSELNDPEADVDVKGRFSEIGITIYVRGKLHSKLVDKAGIDQLIKYKYEEDQNFSIYQPVKWFITTGEVSGADVDYANENGIRIIQQDQFAEMLVESGFKFNSEIFLKQ